MALATALCRARRRWIAARQDTQSGQGAVAAGAIARVLALPCGEPPNAATHRTGRMVASTVGISLSAVQRIWQVHRLLPHRIRTFKTSNDPAFAAKVEGIVGL